MAKLTPQERVLAVEVTLRVKLAKQEHERANYVRRQRVRLPYGISDHAVDDGGNIWHPNANKFIGSSIIGEQ
jgi:hypothetical protein